MSDNAIIVVAIISMAQAVLLGLIGALVAWIQWKTKSSVERAGKRAARHAQHAASKAAEVAVEVKQVAVDAARAADKVEEVRSVLQEDQAHGDQRADKTAARVEEVVSTFIDGRKVINDKLDALGVVADTTHRLVNSGYTKQLEMVAELSRWKANQTSDPVHVRAAEDAERMLKEHLTKQAVADARGGNGK